MNHELKMKELELGGHTKSRTQSGFDFAKNIRLVPKFDHKEVAKYFTLFENLVQKLKWPKEHWTTLLHSVFEGKAKDAYTVLSPEQSSDYDVVKQRILKEMNKVYLYVISSISNTILLG